MIEKNYRLQDIQLSKIRGYRLAPTANRADQREPICQIRGGEYRARTGDLLVANQALSQLS